MLAYILSHRMRVRGLKPSLKILGLYTIMSHPMRVRGLKLSIFKFCFQRLNVAPHAGAWIETTQCLPLILNLLVAPHAGAWIETPPLRRIYSLSKVAPHAGAWIETCQEGGYI